MVVPKIKMTKTKSRIPKLWRQEYHGRFRLINLTNYLDLLMELIIFFVFY